MKRLLLMPLLLASGALCKTFTLEQVLSAPFPSELVAAPGGAKVAWLLNERGARNVWIAAAPDFKGVRLTSYTEDDGQDIGQLRWTPDARAVVYVRGGDLEFPGRPDPNPTADPAGVEQAIWIAAPGEAPRKIGVGHSPEISPKGDRVAYLLGGQIWSAPLSGSGAAPLVGARAGVTAAQLRWSPDGTKLAYVSDRANHAFLAVYEFAAKSLTYLDPGTDRDANPVWSPDSRQLAFTRMSMSGVVGAGRGARTSPDPWTIRVANLAEGSGRQVWKADPGPGSAFRAVVAEDQIYWAAGNRLVFPWEKDGWTHLYSIPVDGGAPVLLTPGNFEVEHVAYTEDGKEIVYSSNQDDIDRRHIWRVSTAAGPPRPVTKGEALEWTPVPISGGIAYLRADARHPARASIQMGAGAARDLAPSTIPGDFPGDALVIPQPVLYTATDGMQIHAQRFFLPPTGQPGARRPAIVFMHGGSRRQMLLGWHYMAYYNNAYAMNQYLANQGYIVLSINYRSGIGYGLNFREAVNFGAGGASEYRDVEGAGLYLKTRPDVDPAHIGLWGGSYGGYLTALGLARASDLFAAGVDFHGVHDWSTRINPNAAAPTSGADSASRDDSARTAFESSPMASVRTWRSPVLLIHGDDDRNVNFSETITLASALRQQGVYFEQLILPDEIHGFLRHASWLRGYHAAADFFRRKL